MTIDETLNDWFKRMDNKTNQIVDSIDKSLEKAALFCRGKAEENAMDAIYNQPINERYAYKRPENQGKNNGYYYKRTGLYKASMDSGMNPDLEHSAIVCNNVPYAKVLEYGDSKGHTAKYIVTDAIVKNTEDIKKIIKSGIGEVTK